MTEFRNKLIGFVRRLFDRREELPRPGPGAVRREWFETQHWQETERAFAWHGVEGHEWEELEE